MKTMELSYFPGCSLATTAKENNASLHRFLSRFGIRLNEIDDWNCCGSSSTHSINADLAVSLAARNLFLAPPGKPLLVACPGCFLRLKHAQMDLAGDPEKQAKYQAMFGLPYHPDTELVHFFELLVQMDKAGRFKGLERRLNNLRIAPYYGCMLARPPRMRNERNFFGLIEKTMTAFGGEALQWPFYARCCGTFLSVSRPDIAGKQVNHIMEGAIRAGAECIVTACAMCHLNLEIRCNPENRIPVFHFSELLSLAVEGHAPKDWLKRHLIDPKPLLERREVGTLS
ncbi:MAG: heterodisulfide reductase-related iron-sulfur binding cluster [Desulfobacter sp.]